MVVQCRTWQRTGCAWRQRLPASYVLHRETMQEPLRQHGPHVVLQEACLTVVPNALADVWHGYGGDPHDNIELARRGRIDTRKREPTVTTFTDGG